MLSILVYWADRILSSSLLQTRGMESRLKLKVIMWRRLLHRGTNYRNPFLYHRLTSFFFSQQAKSGKELKAFLFNDFLLLTRPQSSITGNLSKKIGFDSNIKYTLYRQVKNYSYD